MDGYTRVGRAAEFKEGRIRVFLVGGGRVAVVNWRDKFYAFDDYCTHQGVSLRSGWVTEDKEVVCMVHYAVYELATGRVVDGPNAIDDLPVYDVRVEGEDVLVGRA